MVFTGRPLREFVPIGIYLLKAKNRKTRTIKYFQSKQLRFPQQRSVVLIANFEQILHIFLTFSLLTLNE